MFRDSILRTHKRYKTMFLEFRVNLFGGKKDDGYFPPTSQMKKKSSLLLPDIEENGGSQ